MKLMSHIKKAIQDMFFIWYYEIKNVFRDSGVIIFFLVVPLAYPVLYGLIYNREVVEDVPLAVIDLSVSQLSREMLRKIDASPDVKIAMYCSDMEEARRCLDEKKAYGILYIPYQFGKDIETGRQTSVSLYADMGSLLYYKAFLLSATEASLDLGKDIQISRMTNATAKTEDIMTQPVPYESVALYNTQNGFASFLVPAILILVIQQTLLLGIGMLAATDREKNYGRQLVPVNLRYEGMFRVVFGKSLAYLLIYVPVCIWTLLIIPHIFNLPRIAQPGTITLFILPYLFASIFFAMSVSCFMKERENPMLLLVFTSLPLLFISGVSWPESAISPFWEMIGTLIPSTHGIQGFIRVNSMGAGLSEVAQEYKSLWILTGFYFILTCILYRWEMVRASRIRRDRLEEIKKHKNEPDENLVQNFAGERG